MLRTNESRYLDGSSVARCQWKSFEQRYGKGCGKGVAGADRIGYFDAGSLHVRRLSAGCRNTAAAAAFGKDDVTERKAFEKLPDRLFGIVAKRKAAGNDR